MRDIIIESFAKALHACAWADCVEEWGIENLSGCEILDVMDPVTSAARDTARIAVEQIEKNNGMFINIAYEVVAAKPLEHGWEIEAEPADFGHYLAMEWLGHGVAWSDDHPNHDLKIGHGEFYYFHPSEFGRKGNEVDVRPFGRDAV